MATECDTYLVLLEEAFRKQAWHGPNLRGSIRGLTDREAAWRPGRGRHSIREIVVHAAYWKYAVAQRIAGGKRGSFARKGSNWFPQERLEATWRDDVTLLVEMHRRLWDAVRALSPADLDRRSGKLTLRRLIYGAALHDVYHAGQIQLLKRLLRR